MKTTNRLGLHIHFEEDIYIGGYRLYLFIRNSDGSISVPTKIEMTTLNEGCQEPSSPFPSIPFEALNELAEELDGKGIKTDKDFTIKGKLDAQSYHLEDLRTLLKLKK